MAASPLQSVGLWRAWESAREGAIPLLMATAAWSIAAPQLRAPSAGRPLTPLELGVMLGSLAAVTSWAMARQWVILGRRKPLTPVLWGTAAGLIAVGLAGPFARMGFEGWCADTALGAVVRLSPLDGRGAGVACQVHSVPGNPYLMGTLVLPTWGGVLSLPLWLLVAASAALAATGLRDLRLWRTRVGSRLLADLELSPGAGSGAVVGPPAMGPGGVQACRNATLWGELCGQLYAAERVFAPGEWCVRCQQPFRASDRTLRLAVVSLFTVELDVLNGLERLDMQSWDPGSAAPSDPRLSGQERWVLLHDIVLPDVLTVAQAIALVIEGLGPLTGARDPRVAQAATLAVQRASRVACWFWAGRPVDRLTYARPTRDVVLGVGPDRLRDLLGESGEQVTLQLELGLMPVELRTAFCKRFLEPGRDDVVQNSKQDLWLPVGPLEPTKDDPGAWVPRVEGEALRTWLSLDRVRPAGVRGVSVPLAYTPHRSGAEVSVSTNVPPPPQGYDLVRMRLLAEDNEPDMRRTLGDSIAEWDWLEPEQLTLLRQQALVLVDPRVEGA